MGTVSNRTRIGYQQATERAISHAPAKPADLSLPHDQFWFEELLDASIRVDLLERHHRTNCTRSDRALGIARVAVCSARDAFELAWQRYRHYAPISTRIAA